MPVVVDPALRLGERQLALHDRPPVADDARDDPEPGGDPGVEEAARGAGDQRRVEVVGGAVQVDAGARHPCGQQRRAEARAPAAKSSSTKASSDVRTCMRPEVDRLEEGRADSRRRCAAS